MASYPDAHAVESGYARDGREGYVGLRAEPSSPASRVTARTVVFVVQCTLELQIHFFRAHGAPNGVRARWRSSGVSFFGISERAGIDEGQAGRYRKSSIGFAWWVFQLMRLWCAELSIASSAFTFLTYGICLLFFLMKRFGEFRAREKEAWFW